MPVADSIIVFVTGALFIVEQDSYVIQWISSNGESNGGQGETVIGIEESAPVVNARILADAKIDHNTRYATDFGPSTPDMLVGGIVA